MEEEIKKLQDQIKNLEAKGSQVPVVYLKSDRKFPKFGGRPVKDGDPDVYEWISDMREHIQSTKSKDDFVDFIMDHLTGSAKSEVKLRPLQERGRSRQRFGPRFNRGRNGRQGSNRGRQCYNCGGLGHMSMNCPSENTPPTGSRRTSGNPNWKPSQ